ncbi:50S ribosomal protein L4 [Companilactobacillus alimentarius]|uniref:Large ribosomal subunit protein uL4 n=1 Tax=Companilactobacillus alimentarius DSM 20249 TaxID=1423720 RepID=A0A2K9HJM9_9LACO|nr:50S ribosomal protein L4 [Companilactobacillus alimentarius]AUI72588.1 50S ribosomal protein L4 [Companilactobacillus alimentarius DSM 20249]KRK76381.1 50S ribosomal protein L4 [Companilactobacillus alimentarius DSM 20249]MDT6952289.1 50S ribosomal protein L4 [Companilactobacillus alimentarius]GEO45598.1 50S ribosomal protein L4 [Companilactobacillus alimentarius]
MTKITAYKDNGAENGAVDVKDEVFGVEPNNNVVTDAVIMQRASMRQGTHDVKNRSEVRGGGRKPWRQKGTGRARQGSIRSPQWVGGGVVFGPTPRSYAYHLPKKVSRLALKSVLSQKAADSNLIVIDSISYDKPSTKNFAQLLNKVGADNKVLVVVEDGNDNVALSARNIDKVQVVAPEGVNVLDVINANKLVVTQAALSKIEEVLG